MRTDAHGGDVYSRPYRYDFSVNVNPLGPPPQALWAARESLEYLERYPDVRCRALRRALARAQGVEEDELLFGNGASELIYCLAQTLRPARTLLLSPTFSEYERALLSAGGEILTYDLSPERGFRAGAGLLDAIRSGPELVILCNPNNPTGVVTDRELLLLAADLCEERGCYLMVDECFVELLEHPERTTMKDALRGHPHLMLLRAFTKTYAMPALRLGYLMSANRELLRLLERRLPPWNVSVPAQMSAEAALGAEDYLLRARKLIREEREYLARGLRALGLRVWDSEANYLLFFGAPDLSERLAGEGILIRDCGNYRGLREGYYRVAVRKREENQALLWALRRSCGEESRHLSPGTESGEKEGGTTVGESNHDPGNHVERGKKSSVCGTLQDLP